MEEDRDYATFHLCNVGQGNCHLIHYPEEKVAFIFDAGSTANKKFAKFLADKDEMVEFMKYESSSINQKIGDEVNDKETDALLSKTVVQHQEDIPSNPKKNKNSDDFSETQHSQLKILSKQFTKKVP